MSGFLIKTKDRPCLAKDILIDYITHKLSDLIDIFKMSLDH